MSNMFEITECITHFDTGRKARVRLIESFEAFDGLEGALRPGAHMGQPGLPVITSRGPAVLTVAPASNPTSYLEYQRCLPLPADCAECGKPCKGPDDDYCSDECARTAAVLPSLTPEVLSAFVADVSAKLAAHLPGVTVCADCARPGGQAQVILFAAWDGMQRVTWSRPSLLAAEYTPELVDEAVGALFDDIARRTVDRRVKELLAPRYAPGRGPK